MHAIILELSNNAYDNKNVLNNHLDALAIFLTDDTADISFFKDWLASSSTDTGGNMTWLTKHDNMIEISIDEALEYPYVCVISQENFAQLLDQWTYICHNDIPRIVLYEENGQILLAPYEEDQA